MHVLLFKEIANRLLGCVFRIHFFHVWICMFVSWIVFCFLIFKNFFSGLMETSVESVQSEKVRGQSSTSHSAKVRTRGLKRWNSQQSIGQSCLQKHWWEKALAAASFHNDFIKLVSMNRFIQIYLFRVQECVFWLLEVGFFFFLTCLFCLYLQRFRTEFSEGKITGRVSRSSSKLNI